MAEFERLKTLREQRGKLGGEMRALTDLAEAEKRDLTAEELAKHGELFDRQDGLRKQVEVLERQIELDRQLASAAGEEESRQRSREPKGTAELQMAGFRSYLRTGTILGEGSEEFRALQAGSNVEGGYVVAPPTFVTTLLKGLDDAVFIRARATKYPLATSTSLGVPTLDGDLDDADWTAELTTGREDDGLKFGKRELRPHPLAKRIKVSKKLLRQAVLPIEQIVASRMNYKFGVSQEKGFLTGDGVQKPLGLFTVSKDGIPAGRDIAVGNTATAIGFDGLIEAKYSVKAQYWPRSAWLFHRDAVKALTKLKDGDSQYIWRQSVKEDEPDMLLGRPLTISEFAPNTFTTGKLVGLFGDLSFYWIADALDLQVQRLVELYAETNQDGFIGRLETDGMPVLAEAFARVKLA
ncbi:MAG: phage major capsid protein [Azospirillum sp.]|nr:phage major capsid protein [Azospirillum sp.]